MLKVLTIKHAITFVTGFSCFSYYSYKKHLYEKEMFDQYNYLSSNNIKLSGVRVQQRRPFGNSFYLKPFQWSMPFHWSLKIFLPDDAVRHVGIAKAFRGVKGFSLESEFVLHVGGNYDGYLNDLESSFPIEVWVDYKRKFGEFPMHVDVEHLVKLTKTRTEATPEEVPQLYTITFGKPGYDAAGNFRFATCRSAVMDVTHSANDYGKKKQQLLIE